MKKSAKAEGTSPKVKARFVTWIPHSNDFRYACVGTSAISTLLLISTVSMLKIHYYYYCKLERILNNTHLFASTQLSIEENVVEYN